MAARLIYHTSESMAGGVSPFDAAVTAMADGQDLRIACPYLGLAYLQRLIGRATGWRVLTDVEEWLGSQPHKARREIVEFVQANADRVRHCKDLHAKVLIAGAKALTGSANFTEKGMTGRVEVSVLFDGCDEVEELRAWFDLLWSRTAAVAETDLRACVEAMPPPNPSAFPTPLPCAFPGVMSRLQPLDPIGGSPDAEQRLVARLRLAPNRRWAESWLDLANELIEATGLGNEDSRLVMSLPQGNFLPVTINRRYVLTAFRIEEGGHEKHYLIPDYANPPGHAVVELILPATMKGRIDNLPGAIRHSSFDPGYKGETGEHVPRFVSFSKPAEFDFPPDVLDGWREALAAERDHQRTSTYRKYHELVVYRAAIDLDYRRRLLDLAFPTGGSSA